MQKAAILHHNIQQRSVHLNEMRWEARCGKVERRGFCQTETSISWHSSKFSFPKYESDSLRVYKRWWRERHRWRRWRERAPHTRSPKNAFKGSGHYDATKGKLFEHKMEMEFANEITVLGSFERNARSNPALDCSYPPWTASTCNSPSLWQRVVCLRVSDTRFRIFIRENHAQLPLGIIACGKLRNQAYTQWATGCKMN